MQTCLTIFIYLNCLNFCVTISYHNYTLYRGIPVNKSHLDFFKTLSEKYVVNFWREPGTLNKSIDFVVSPQDKPNFLKEADEYGIYLTTVIEDVQKAFDTQTIGTYIRRKMTTFDWRDFYRLDCIYNWLKDLAATFPNEMKVLSIGKTYEGRDILAVKIRLEGSARRSKVIVEGGIHAREWISPAFVTYLIYNIVNAKTLNQPNLKDIAMAYEWFIVPVMNPDGYEYTFDRDRMWRKNRRPFGKYFGVDLNRNFDIAFGGVGVSKSSVEDTFCGYSALSEKETAAMSGFVKGNSAKLEYYLAFHSYGQYMIIPYANLKTHEDNFDEVRDMCSEAGSIIEARYGTRYKIGTAYDTVGYLTSGVSGCWVKKEFRVPYVVTFELRDTGKYGFALPPKQIRPTCVETLAGVLSLLNPRTERFKKLPLKYLGMNKATCCLLKEYVLPFSLSVSFLSKIYLLQYI